MTEAVLRLLEEKEIPLSVFVHTFNATRILPGKYQVVPNDDGEYEADFTIRSENEKPLTTILTYSGNHLLRMFEFNNEESIGE